MTSTSASPNLLTEFIAGNAFGAALTASGVFAPAVITSQMELRSFHMRKTMMAASATSALAIAAADYFSIAKSKPKTASTLGLFSMDGNAIGGLLLGLGMATTGACPGTSLVQLAVGMPRGQLVVVGGVLGGLLYPYLLPRLQRLCQNGTSSRSSPTSSPNPTTPIKKDNLTIQDSFNISPLAVLIGWEIMCLSLLRVASIYFPSAQPRARLSAAPSYGVVDPAIGGIFVGLAQAVSVFINHHTVGTSGLYRDVSDYLTHGYSTLKKSGRFSFPPAKLILTSSVVFGAGIMSASYILTNTVFDQEYAFLRQNAAPESGIVAGLSIVGGAMMVIGARLAGGCTSGHGISGMSTFSWSSFVTVGAMLAGGIQTAWLLQKFVA